MATDSGKFAVSWAAAETDSVVVVFLLTRGILWFFGVPPFMEPGLARSDGVPQLTRLWHRPPRPRSIGVGKAVLLAFTVRHVAGCLLRLATRESSLVG